MPRSAAEALPRSRDELAKPPITDPSDWADGALSVTSFCSKYDVSRSQAFQFMSAGKLVWGRLGRNRRISRRSARDLFVNQLEA